MASASTSVTGYSSRRPGQIAAWVAQWEAKVHQSIEHGQAIHREIAAQRPDDSHEVLIRESPEAAAFRAMTYDDIRRANLRRSPPAMLRAREQRLEDAMADVEPDDMMRFGESGRLRQIEDRLASIRELPDTGSGAHRMILDLDWPPREYASRLRQYASRLRDYASRSRDYASMRQRQQLEVLRARQREEDYAGFAERAMFAIDDMPDSHSFGEVFVIPQATHVFVLGDVPGLLRWLIPEHCIWRQYYPVPRGIVAVSRRDRGQTTGYVKHYWLSQWEKKVQTCAICYDPVFYFKAAPCPCCKRQDMHPACRAKCKRCPLCQFS